MRPLPPILLLLLLLPSASAHAVLASATPAPNGHADVGVTSIEIRFTEDVEREYTSADVIDPQGESWAAGPIAFDEAQHNVVRLPVRPLEDGLYSVSWKALSVDTHTTRGSFVIAVGTATLRPGQIAASASDPGDHDFGAVARDGFARFAFYLGLFLVVGVPLFALVVLRAEPPRGLFAAATSFGVVGAAGALVGLLFLAQRTGLGMDALGTSPGRSLLLRALLTLAATLAVGAAVARPRAWRVASGAAVALGAGAMLATATGSHAAAAKEYAALLIAADALHLAMGAVWIGGIVAFLHVGWGRSALEVSGYIQRFSPLAVGSVVLLLATGGIASFAHMACARVNPVECIAAMRTENYVRLVAFKLALMLPLIALGAFHKYRAGPRLARGAYSPSAFRRLIQVEAAIMALILGAAGILAASAPPEPEVETGEAYVPYLELSNITQKSHVIVQVSPNPVTVGVQELVVAVHPLGARLPNGTLVAIKVWLATEEEPELTLYPEKVTPDEWEISDGLFTSAGDWKLLVIVQRPDEYAKLTFTIPVVNPQGV